MKFKVRIPLQYVKPVLYRRRSRGHLCCCRWAAGSPACVCCWALTCWRKAATAAPTAAKKLDMKYPLFKGSCCPACKAELRPAAEKNAAK